MTMTIMNLRDTFMKRWSVEILTWVNFTLWFSHMKQWLTSEELWYAVENWLSASDTPDSSVSFSLHDLDFENQKINTKTLYWINTCISVDDQELLMNKVTAKEIWHFLKIKYKQRLSTADRQCLADFTVYKMSSNELINEIWTHLTKLDRKIATTWLDLSSLNTLKQQFQALLHELLKKYCMTCNSIDSQHTTVDEDIALLQEKEVQLKAEMILCARSQRDDEWEQGHCSQQDMRYDFKWAPSQHSDCFSQHKSFSCFLCSETHHMHDCKYASVVKWAVQSAICSEKLSKLTAVNS